jgi:DNA-binding NtrC family response regulator
MTARILVVDDEKMVRWSLSQALQEVGHSVDVAVDAAEALELVGRDVPDAVLLDYRLPDRTGVEVLREIQRIAPRLPVVMITAHASIGGAVEAMKEGAYDYLSKPFDVDTVLLTVERALEAGRLREKLARQHEQAQREFGIQNIVAASASMKEVVRLVEKVGRSEASTILLLGESGVGKGLIARALHVAGGNWDSPFMHITCTALAESLLESELFGHEKGAFTDARTQKKGLLELADGGTVFLDEIGDLSPGLQGKLLRFLEDKVFRRVGGTRDLHVNVRVIAATNKDLAKQVDKGIFRNDLYFRLKVIPIDVPPLRNRVEDVLPLAEGFVRHFDQEFRKSVRGIEPGAVELMKAYSWPGNVRELRNAIERAVLLTDHDVLTVKDLPEEIRRGAGTEAGLAGEAGEAFRLPKSGVHLDEVEKHLVAQALDRARGNRTRAARLLGLNRDQIRYRIEKFHLEENSSEHDDGVAAG